MSTTLDIVVCKICGDSHSTLFRCKDGYVCEKHQETQILFRKFTKSQKRAMKAQRAKIRLERKHDQPNPTLPGPA